MRLTRNIRSRAWLRASDVASYLSLTSRGVYLAPRRGEIPGAVHLGRRWRFDAAVIRNWLKTISRSEARSRRPS
jgi:predicted DNA-binding transcriptional regulator AlpA